MENVKNKHFNGDGGIDNAKKSDTYTYAYVTFVLYGRDCVEAHSGCGDDDKDQGDNLHYLKKEPIDTARMCLCPIIGG